MQWHLELNQSHLRSLFPTTPEVEGGEEEEETGGVVADLSREHLQSRSVEDPR